MREEQEREGEEEKEDDDEEEGSHPWEKGLGLMDVDASSLRTELAVLSESLTSFTTSMIR